MKKLLLIALLAITTVCFAQKQPAKFGDIPMEDMKMKVYPQDSSAEAVILVDYGTSTIEYNDAQSRGFQLYFERLRRIKILKKEGLSWANFDIPLYHNEELEEKISSIKVMTYNLENGKIIETKTKSDAFFKEKSDANWNITKVAWANVKEGSIIEITYKITSDFLFNFQDWEFQSTIPTRLSEYRATIPEYYNYEKYMQGYIPLKVAETSTANQFITINYASGGNNYDEAAGGARRHSLGQEKIEYIANKSRWVSSEVPAFKKEPFITSARDYISKINFELSYTKFPTEFSNAGIKKYMGTWEDINRTYWELIGGKITGNNSLKDEMETTIAGVTDPEEKMAKIFNYVKNNVLWNEESTKFAENSPKKTLDEKKGNSAEVNILLACLLEKADIKVSPVLLSTRNHGFVRETMPVSSQFNYVICLAKIGNKSFLLDATDKFLPIGMLPERCLNGKGFVVSKEGFQWINLEVSTKTRRTISADLNLSVAGELTGKIKIDRTGYTSVDARKSYFSKGEKEYISDLAKGKPWTITKSEFENTDNISLPFKEKHELTIAEHISEAGNTIYLNPFVLSRITENPFKTQERKYPVDFGYGFDETYLMKITIPDGYMIDELPKSKALSMPGNAGRYSYNLVQVGNALSITSSFSINRGLVSQEEYPNLREFYSQVVAKQAEQIVLKKK